MLNIINFHLGIKNTLSSNSLFSFSFGKNKRNSISDQVILNNVTDQNERLFFKDYKTTLKGWEVNKVRDFCCDVDAYFFIDKTPDISGWKLVLPVIHEKSSNKTYQFKRACFTFDGCGGGLWNSEKLILELLKLRSKGIKVNFIPKVVENDLLIAFEYCDSGKTLQDLIMNSVDLVNYRIGSLDSTYKKYTEIINKN